MSGTLRFLSAVDVAKALPMKAAVDAVRDAFVQLSNREADVPLRTTMELAGDGGALIMPVHLPGQHRLGLKVITVVPDNPARGLPTTQALVVVFDATTGSAEAVMDGEVLTAVRTGAASGVATDALARADSAVVAVIGGGAQGRRQLEGVCAVRTIREALVYDADQESALLFADEMGELLGFPVRVLHDVAGVREADVLCTATSSNEPVVRDKDIASGDPHQRHRHLPAGHPRDPGCDRGAVAAGGGFAQGLSDRGGRPGAGGPGGSARRPRPAG